MTKEIKKKSSGPKPLQTYRTTACNRNYGSVSLQKAL